MGVDIGGTFTDLVLYDPAAGRWRAAKVPTDPADPVRCVIGGLDELVSGAEVARVGLVCHATTLGVNAIIQRRGGTAGLLVSEGFEDVIEMGSGQRYDIYELFPTYPEPLVPGARRHPIRQRRGPAGETLVDLDAGDVEAATRRLLADGADAVAICFLHSYADAADERRAAEIVRGMAPAMRLSLSSDVASEIREYPRLVTTAANAYIQPLVSSYLERLGAELESRGYACTLLTMLSAGGMASVDAASAFPVRLLESGPAAGAVLAERLSARSRWPDLLVFDMGGTTAKASIVLDGQALRTGQLEVGRVHRFKAGSGMPVRTPAIDLLEIGAGGGSIARADRLGLLAVGPESAEADPGPACYGRGGREATVTDADLVLGYLGPDSFLGGRMRLDVEAARTALAGLGACFGMDATRAAWYVHSAVNDNMAGAARIHLAERGVEAGRLAMLALGGAAPVHAEAVARGIGVRTVIVPPAPGVGSAAGLLLAPLAFDLSSSAPGRLEDLRWTELAELYADLERRATELVVHAGARRAEIALTRSVEMRVEGQVHEIEVPFPGPIDEAVQARIATAFEEAYRSRFRHPPLPRPRRVVTWRVRASAPGAATAPGGQQPQEAPGRELSGERQVYFPEAGGFLATRVVRRSALEPGAVERGPLVIEEDASTTVLGPRAGVTVLDDLSLLVDLR